MTLIPNYQNISDQKYFGKSPVHIPEVQIAAYLLVITAKSTCFLKKASHEKLHQPFQLTRIQIIMHHMPTPEQQSTSST